VTEDATCNVNGQANIKISPTLNAGGLTQAKAFKNVNAKAADNAVIHIIGEASSTYNQSFFCSSATLVYVPVTLPNLESLRDYVRFEETKGFHIFFGVKTVYPDLGIRVINKKHG